MKPSLSLGVLAAEPGHSGGWRGELFQRHAVHAKHLLPLPDAGQWAEVHRDGAGHQQRRTEAERHRKQRQRRGEQLSNILLKPLLQ